MSTYYHSPSDQTIKALDHCRKQYAETKGTTRNAVDQLFAGNTHDAYPPFREQFKDVCLTQEADPDAYLDDLLAIKQSARGGAGIGLAEAFLAKLQSVHEAIEAYARYAEDGQLDYSECLDLIPLLSRVETRVTNLKKAVIDQKNELANMPNRVFAHQAVKRR